MEDIPPGQLMGKKAILDVHGTIPRAPVKSKGKGAPEGWSSFSLLPGTDPCLNCPLLPRPGCHGGLRHLSKASLLPWVVYDRHSVSARRKWIQWESPFYKCWEAQIQETWPKGFTAEVAKPRLSVRLTLHTSCFMTVFPSKETLGTRCLQKIGCTYTDFTLHFALFYLAFSGHVWVGLYTFPEIRGHLGSLCLIWPFSILFYQVPNFKV